jgi:integrase
MVLLIGSTGLRRSETIALTWSDLDFLFPSVRFKGTKPFSLDSILGQECSSRVGTNRSCRKNNRLAQLRHSLATNLRALGVDIKVAQKLMRHSSCRTMLYVYTRAVDQQKRAKRA